MAASSFKTAQEAAGIQPSTLVMLDRGSGILSALDVENGHLTKITEVKMYYFLRITSVQDELYLFQDTKLHKYLNTGTWEKRACAGNDPYPDDDFMQIAVFRGQIYFIDPYGMACYNPSENVWTEGLPGCEHGAGYCVTASKEYIYVLGGWGSAREAKRFDPVSKKWLVMPAMKEARWNAAAIVFREKLYVMGGDDDTLKNPQRSLSSYNPSTDIWEELGNMNIPRTWFSAVVYNDKIYVIGGAMDKQGDIFHEESVEVFNEELNKWEVVQILPKSEGRITACACKSIVTQHSDKDEVDQILRQSDHVLSSIKIQDDV